MSNDIRQVTTEEERERLYRAKRRGGLCAACGRVLDQDEPVYTERFMVTRQVPTEALVGAECASPELLRQTEQQVPEPCAGCDRPIYYRVNRQRRHQARCSLRCGSRVAAAKRAARTGAI